MTPLKIFSETLGYAYFLFWSLSNCPQIVKNFRSKTVAGLSIEFQCLNTLGFTFYAIYVSFGFYFQHHWDLTRSIVIQDLLFAAICGGSVYVLSFQCFILYPKTITGSVHKFYQFVIFGLLLVASYNIILGCTNTLQWFSKSEEAYTYSVIHFLGYGKSFISFIKYVPQVYLNFSRQHTAGLSILNFLMDMLGGSCSFLQMFVNAYIDTRADGSPDFSHITSNIPKLLLSVESVVFDLIIMSQYFWYKKRTEKMLQDQSSHGYGDQETALLGTDIDSGDSNSYTSTNNMFNNAEGYTDNSNSVNTANTSPNSKLFKYTE